MMVIVSIPHQFDCEIKTAIMEESTLEDLIVIAGRMEAHVTALAIAAGCYPSYMEDGLQRINQLRELASRIRADVMFLVHQDKN